MKKYLVLICLVLGCASIPRHEIALYLPQAPPIVIKPVQPLPQLHYLTMKEFAVEKLILQEDSNKVIAKIDEIEWSYRHQIYHIDEKLQANCDSINSNSSSEDIVEARRLLAKYEQLADEVIQMDRHIQERLKEIESPP